MFGVGNALRKLGQGVGVGHPWSRYGSRTISWPLPSTLDSTACDRDSTKARKVEKWSVFSLKAGFIRCIWLFTPPA